LDQSHILFTEDTFIQNVINGNVTEVELFLKAGIDPNGRFRGDEVTVGDLIVGSGDTALILATGLNHTDVVRVLLDYNANVNEKGLRGRTALMLARSGMAQLLLDKQADVNARGDSGWTALMSAATRDEPETIGLLIKAGTDINAKLKDGATALMLAVFEGRAKAIKELLARGANAKAQMNDGRTAIVIAAENNRTEIVEILKNTRGSRN
jgi:ankyrin repeat protein